MISRQTWFGIAAVAVVAAVVVVVVLASGGGDGGPVDAAVTETTEAGDTAGTAATTEVGASDGEEATTTTEGTTTTTARVPTTEEIRSASLLFTWPVVFTKTGTVTAVPDWAEIEVGRVYMVDVEVEGVCDDAGNCIQQSIPHVASPAILQTPSEPLVPTEWVMNGDRWTNTMVGYHVSASYGDRGTCVYEWIEEWDVAITDAVSNGDAWLATELEGTMRRTQRIEPGRSALAITNGYCSAGDWDQVDDWDVRSVRNLAPTA